MSRDDHQMKIRLPEELKNRIEKSAAEGGRTLNAEIVFRLERAYAIVEPEFQAAEQRFAEALLMQRYDSLQNQWRIERTRVETLRDRVDRLRRDREPQDVIDAATNELAMAEFDLKELATNRSLAMKELVALSKANLS
ncbi:Arc family DNA-binding protein [Diaphorobacter sp. HDW4B]|uniref:Arc family DNA-binding protein n=1 Tax=Diaphorobacter sp. HDW4B TaxID=2714925 RepID=UPI001407A3B6|nr:Arc family DNA-binding protein [Diaphorobacter sp. HDW4B]QIL71638.1 Arc family DNA-binding protein [Diaphorobacter sp. HDW4B]